MYDLLFYFISRHIFIAHSVWKKWIITFLFSENFNFKILATHRKSLFS